MKNGDDNRFFNPHVPVLLVGAAGACLILFGAFAILLGFIEPHGRHGAGGLKAMSTLGIIVLVVGVGFLMPQLPAKLCSALFLVGAAMWLFVTDTFRSQNWWIYCLSFVPLFLTLWLWKGQKILQKRRLTNAH